MATSDWNSDAFFDEVIHKKKDIVPDWRVKKAEKLHKEKETQARKERERKRNEERLLICTLRPRGNLPVGREFEGDVRSLLTQHGYTGPPVSIRVFKRNTTHQDISHLGNIDDADRDTKIVIDPFPVQCNFMMLHELTTFLEGRFDMFGMNGHRSSDIFFRVMRREDANARF